MAARGRGLGRGRGIGRGRGKPQLKDVPNLSEEDKRRLIEDGQPPNKTNDEQFEDKEQLVSATQTGIPSDTRSEDSHTSKESLVTTSPPESALNSDSKDFNPTMVNGHSSSDTKTPAAHSSSSTKTAVDITSARSKSTPAKLNPNSSEFVPKASRLNVMAAEFIPTAYLPPPTAPPTTEQAPPIDNDNMLTPLDILEGFDRKSPIDDPVLEEAADMLITATVYPGSYDELLLEFSESIKTTPPSDMVLQDIGEMLLHWGINSNGLRYTAVRMCDFMCKADLGARFRGHFFTVLQRLFKEEQEKSNRSEADIDRLMEFSLFVAEMFYRIRMKDEVVWVLGLATVELMFILVDIKQDDTIKCACNIMKLTGYLLENKTSPTKKFNPHQKMDTLVMALKHLCNDKSLGTRVCEVIINVLTFRGKKYERIAQPPSPPDVKPIVEAPVQHEEDWSQFVDEMGNVIEGTEDQDYEHYYDVGDDIDPNIDDEIMRGYEEFLQDFEDHLLLQEFGHK